MRDRRRNGRNPSGLPALVEDVLESNAGEWLTIARVVVEVQQARPAAAAAAIARAVWRVAGDPGIELQRRVSRAGGVAELQLKCPVRAYWTEVAA